MIRFNPNEVVKLIENNGNAISAIEIILRIKAMIGRWPDEKEWDMLFHQFFDLKQNQQLEFRADGIFLIN